jgi:hypothetical protein
VNAGGAYEIDVPDFGTPPRKALAVGKTRTPAVRAL